MNANEKAWVMNKVAMLNCELEQARKENERLRRENKTLRETLTSTAEELHEIVDIHGDPGDMTRTPTRKIHELAECLDDMMKPATEEVSA